MVLTVLVVVVVVVAGLGFPRRRVMREGLVVRVVV